MSYTKGPWIADLRSGCTAIYPESRRNDTPGLHCDDERNICYSNKGAHYNGNHWEMDQETQDNFRLMAAAPDLLEELHIMRDWLRERLGEWLPVEPSHYPNQQLVEMREHLDHIEVVLAKAEGASHE